MGVARGQRGGRRAHQVVLLDLSPINLGIVFDVELGDAEEDEQILRVVIRPIELEGLTLGQVDRSGASTKGSRSSSPVR